MTPILRTDERTTVGRIRLPMSSCCASCPHSFAPNVRRLPVGGKYVCLMAWALRMYWLASSVKLVLMGGIFSEEDLDSIWRRSSCSALLVNWAKELLRVAISV